MKAKNVIILALVCSFTMLTSCFFPGEKPRKEKQPVKMEKKKEDKRR